MERHITPQAKLKSSAYQQGLKDGLYCESVRIDAQGRVHRITRFGARPLPHPAVPDDEDLVWSNQYKIGLYDAGCRFTSDLLQDQLSGLHREYVEPRSLLALVDNQVKVFRTSDIDRSHHAMLPRSEVLYQADTASEGFIFSLVSAATATVTTAGANKTVLLAKNVRPLDAQTARKWTTMHPFTQGESIPLIEGCAAPLESLTRAVKIGESFSDPFADHKGKVLRWNYTTWDVPSSGQFGGITLNLCALVDTTNVHVHFTAMALAAFELKRYLPKDITQGLVERLLSKKMDGMRTGMDMAAQMISSDLNDGRGQQRLASLLRVHPNLMAMFQTAFETRQLAIAA